MSDALVTLEQLVEVMPQAAAIASRWIDPINQALARWEITSRPRIAAFLAQAAHESGQLRHLVENLNYSAEALAMTWPKRFSSEEARRYARDPERIGNRAYANRMGNGDEASGDGYLYRGRGIFQLTGKDNYRRCSIAIAGDADTLLLNPELLEEPAYACESAGWFWSTNGLNEHADQGNFQGITTRINGGLHGYVERLAFHDRALGAFA